MQGGMNMRNITYLLGVLFPLSIFIFYGWRYASRKRTIPCPFWLRWFVEIDNPFTKTNKAVNIIEHSRIQPWMNVVDVGCGPGRVALPVATHVFPDGKLAVVDIQEKMLARVWKKAKEKGLTNIEYIQGKIGSHGFGHHRYDRSLLINVLGEITEKEEAFQDIYTALKPGGILCVAETMFDPHYQKKHAVKELAYATGFEYDGFKGSRVAYSLLFKKPIPTK